MNYLAERASLASLAGSLGRAQLRRTIAYNYISERAGGQPGAADQSVAAAAASAPTRRPDLLGAPSAKRAPPESPEPRGSPRAELWAADAKVAADADAHAHAHADA